MYCLEAGYFYSTCPLVAAGQPPRNPNWQWNRRIRNHPPNIPPPQAGAPYSFPTAAGPPVQYIVVQVYGIGPYDNATPAMDAEKAQMYEKLQQYELKEKEQLRKEKEEKKLQQYKGIIEDSKKQSAEVVTAAMKGLLPLKRAAEALEAQSKEKRATKGGKKTLLGKFPQNNSKRRKKLIQGRVVRRGRRGRG